MGYPVFGKVKTIVLPSPTNQLTYNEYKELYGIDLADIFDLVIDSGEGYIKFKDSVLNCVILIKGNPTTGSVIPLCSLNAFGAESNYVSGAAPLQVLLGTEYSTSEGDYYGLRLDITATDPCDFEHMLISTIEY